MAATRKRAPPPPLGPPPLKTLLLILSFAATLSWASASVSVSASASSPSSSPAPAPAPATPVGASCAAVAAVAEASVGASTPGSPGDGNPVSRLASYVWDQAVRVKDGTVQLYTNHKTCNEIRLRQREYAESRGRRRTISTGGITYAEFDFLQKGKDDRGRLGSLVFMMFFAPNFLPYAIMFNPGMLPSTYAPEGAKGGARRGAVHGGETRRDAVSRVRSHAVVRAMIDLERSARVPPALSGLNPFGKKRVRRSMERMGRLCEAGGSLLSRAGTVGTSGADAVLQALDGQLYSPEPHSKGTAQLVDLPKSIIMGLARAIEAQSPPSYFMPNFLVRGQVLNHIKRLSDADEFLAEHVDLSSLDADLLAEACDARLIGGPGQSDAEMREGLSHWLRAAVLDPRERCQRAGGERDSDSNNNDDSDGDGGGTQQLHFNDNLARAALMAYHAVDAARDERASTYLPRLLFQGQGQRDPYSPTRSPGERGGEGPSEKAVERRGWRERRRAGRNN